MYKDIYGGDTHNTEKIEDKNQMIRSFKMVEE